MLVFLDISISYWLFECYSLGLRTICLGYWASADPHTQPSSYPQNWDHLRPHHEKVACSLLQYLRVEHSRQEFNFKIPLLETKCYTDHRLTNKLHYGAKWIVLTSSCSKVQLWDKIEMQGRCGWGKSITEVLLKAQLLPSSNKLIWQWMKEKVLLHIRCPQTVCVEVCFKAKSF